MFDTLEAYCIHKKIDPKAFKSSEKALWENWEREFISMHPNSFTEQKKFLINKIRRQFPLDKQTI
jgi:hypothetical protein